MIKRILRKFYHFLPCCIRRRVNSYYFDRKLRPLVNKKKFLKKIKRYDVISFDIFDTLITRKIFNPDDLFVMMGNKLGIDDFLNRRKNAEACAIKKFNHDVNIHEIYECYGEIYGDSNLDNIISLEKELELELTYPRFEMLDIFNMLKHDKKIILTSDMYLDKETILKMLKKNGYVGFDYLFLSNDLNARKDIGNIWDIVKSRYGDNIIHIGDNFYSDFELVKKNGISAYRIYSSRDMFRNSYVYRFISHKMDNLSVSESLFYGLMINKNLYNSPFSSLKIDSIEKLGYSLYAPFMNCFMDYICGEIDKKSILLFLSREGYYLQKLYSDYCKINGIDEVKNSYFLVSRKATKGALLSSCRELDSLLDDFFSGSISSFFKQKLQIDYDGADFNIELPSDKKKIYDIILNYKDIIFSNSLRDKENYKKYISSVVDEKKYKNIYLVDLGYSGSIQFNLSKMLCTDLKGLYLLSSDSIKKYSDKSILKFRFDSIINEKYLNIYHYSLLFEYFLSAPFGQLICFDDLGKPVYNDEFMDSDKEKNISKIYSSCIEYMNDINSISKFYNFDSVDSDIEFIFDSFIENNMIDRSVKDKFVYYDDHSFSEEYNIFKRIDRY